jgi:hydrogenase maturation factor
MTWRRKPDMPALTAPEIAALSGCFDCLSPGIKQTYIITLLQQIQVALLDAARTTGSAGGLLTVTATAAANSVRRRFVIQNQKNEELFVKFGTGATTTDYHIALTAHNAGSKHSDPLIFEGYTGAISVAPVAGSPSYTFAEFI